jgi:superfamily II DNA or RNA helicase
MTTETPQNTFKFNSDVGRRLCTSILQPLLPFQPRDAQLDGICAVLDGMNLLAILPTGFGKTGLFYMYMLIMRALSNDPSLCPTRKFSKDPIMVAVCPTKFIEEQLVSDII